MLTVRILHRPLPHPCRIAAADQAPATSQGPIRPDAMDRAPPMPPTPAQQAASAHAAQRAASARTAAKHAWESARVAHEVWLAIFKADLQARSHMLDLRENAAFMETVAARAEAAAQAAAEAADHSNRSRSRSRGAAGSEDAVQSEDASPWV